ncbi:MAG: hypothetical protein FJW64_06655 [Actinobacteria bacterium]|nr:hypothetical protein [Actinomycetota bacterium]
MQIAHIAALGRRLALHFPDGADSSLESAVRRAWTGAMLPDTVSTADADVHVPPPGAHAEQALSDLTAAVTRRAIDRRRGEIWMTHAGGVADPDGRVCMLVGPSGAGKTTATRRLSRRFGYVSDETVAVEPGGRVLPYRKPLSLVVDGESWKRQVAPEELGLRALPDTPLRLSAVIVLDRSRHAPATPRAVPLDTLDALIAVAEHSSGLSSMHRPLATIAACLAAAPPYRLEYRNDADLTGIVEDLLSTPSPRRAGVRHEPPTDEVARAADLPGPPPGLYRRAPFVDAVSDDTRLAVLRHVGHGEGELTVISGIAPEIWRQCATDSDLRTIGERIASVHGSPPPGEPADELLQVGLDDLVRSGVLLRG